MDIVSVGVLTFGGTDPLAVEAVWNGEGDAPEGSYVLFVYTGADPTLPVWDLTVPDRLRGTVRLDDEEKKIMLDLEKRPPGGTVIRIR